MANADKRILVVGATGMLGKPVARQLKAAGFQVRILSRSPEKAAALFGQAFEIYRGEVEDPVSLQTALVGCQGVHINLKGGPRPADYERLEHQGTQALVNAARAAGVRQVTYLSGYTVQEKKAHSPESRAKFKAEQAIRASGIPYTLFRATWFMESLPLFVRGKQALLIGPQPHPLHWVAAADYAQMVSRSYQTPDALNKVFYIYGPQAFTMKAALQLYGRLATPQVQVATIPIGLMTLLGKITFNAEWQSLAESFAYFNQIGEDGDPQEANRLLGAPQTTLQQWSEAQRPGR